MLKNRILMAILDYLATSKNAGNDKAFQSYSVYLDDMSTPVATGITDSTYQFTDLTPGSYTAGVKSVYESGESPVISIDFEVMDEVTFVVQDEDGATMEGAMITMEGDEYMTNANGLATIDLINGTYTYSATLADYYDANGSFEVANGPMTVTINMTAVGLNDAQNQALRVYPNPSQGVINVNSDGQYTITVLNSVGQVVYSNHFTDNAEIDLGNSAQGVYFIRLSSDQKVITKPIIIE